MMAFAFAVTFFPLFFFFLFLRLFTRCHGSNVVVVSSGVRGTCGVFFFFLLLNMTTFPACCMNYPILDRLSLGKKR